MGKDKGNVPKATANGLIKIKKTQPAMSASALGCRPISVDYYGARIEVTDEDALLALLRNIRAASIELA